MDAVSSQAAVPAVWDIVWVDFPFTDRAEMRRRPALVLAATAVQPGFSILWLAMITSATAGPWAFDVPVSDLTSGGLLRPCFVRTSKIASVDARLASRTGLLAPADRPAVAAAMRSLLASVLTP